MINELHLKKYSVKVTFAWWVRLYLYGLAFFAYLMNREPDYDKAADIMMRGATFETVEE